MTAGSKPGSGRHLARFLVAGFVCVHVPVVVFVLVVALDSHPLPGVGRFGALVGGTMLGTAALLWMLYRLYRPVVQVRESLQRDLAQSEERLRLAAEAADFGIHDRCLRSGAFYLSPRLKEILGYPGDAAVDHATAMSHFYPEDRAAGIAAFERACDPGGDGRIDIEQRVIRRDGTVRWLALRGQVYFAQGVPERSLGVWVDVTGEREAREQVRRMNAELESRVEQRTADLRHALEELEAFSYSVSHDLRAPLGALNGFLGLLRMQEAGRFSEDGGRVLAFAESNAGRMTDIVEGLLALSSINSRAIARGDVDMHALVGETVSTYSVERRASIHVGTLPGCVGDAPLLRQVWANLLGNAFKFSRTRTSPRIEVGFDAAARAYFVRDNGVGFELRETSRLFGAFERLHTETEFEGSGIGLAIAQRIVRRHGGRIWAESAPDRGATFWFSVESGHNSAAPLRAGGTH